MVEKIPPDNTKKVLLIGQKNAEGPRAQAYNQPRRKPSDVVVENATEKRYLWTARAFAIIFAVSICCNFILTYAIIATLPLYRVEPYLFSFANKEEQIYKVEPVSKIKEYKYLTEMFVREYVLLRNEFVNDPDEMEQRWGVNSKLREMSSSRVYSKFQEFSTKVIEQIRKHGINRSINFISVTEVGSERGQTWWKVEFKVTDIAPSYEAARSSIWIATLKIDYIVKDVKFGERLNNPLGFTVTDYKSEKVQKGISD